MDIHAPEVLKPPPPTEHQISLPIMSLSPGEKVKLRGDANTLEYEFRRGDEPGNLYEIAFSPKEVFRKADDLNPARKVSASRIGEHVAVLVEYADGARLDVVGRGDSTRKYQSVAFPGMHVDRITTLGKGVVLVTEPEVSVQGTPLSQKNRRVEVIMLDSKGELQTMHADVPDGATGIDFKMSGSVLTAKWKLTSGEIVTSVVVPGGFWKP